LRERGHVPWEDIVDETRDLDDFTGSATVAEDWLRSLDNACLDPWKGDVPTIITESRSLAGVLRAMCRDYRVRLESTNGQCGGFLHTDVGPALSEGDRVGYLGDLDLSGGHIEDNTRAVLEELVGELRWQRLAITEKQVKGYKLPVISKLDKRYKPYRYHDAVETEALSQTLIVNIVRTWLDRLLLPEPLARFQAREQRERDRLRRLIERS
jgi:hypothetical protein